MSYSAPFKCEKIVFEIRSLLCIYLQGPRYQTRIGLLMLLATWMADCPIAVAHFLFNTANVPYVSFDIPTGWNTGNSFIVSDFYCPLITFANSLDPDQD